jgi:DNA mismatch repair protein MutS2
LRQALVFAFAGGGSPEVFDDAVAEASLPASSWDRSAFARDVYLDELVERTLVVRARGKSYPACKRYVARVVGEPPREARDADVRRAILEELASSQIHRESLERVYVAILRLRALLCAARQPAPRVRRVEILRASREVFELLASSFEGAASPVGRLRAFGAAILASKDYRRLADYLDHDEHLGTLDLRVRVGSDGEVRSLEIVALRENRENPFYSSLLGRLLVRIVLFFRGYRTSSGEVAERLLSEVFSGIEEHVVALFQVLGDTEVLLASLVMRDRAMEVGLAVSLPTMLGAGDALELVGLYNPLLLAAGVKPVACDIRASAGGVVVVTGPNSGGKTRLLQGVAIAQMLSQAGLFAPVRQGRVPRATGLFASLFEDARADQPEGHLGMELIRIRRMFDDLDLGAFVVLDELCSGTNPSEGEEIARLVLSLLPELVGRAFVTTHLLQFAAKLAHDRPLAALDFIQVELDSGDRPTYRFVPGVAKTSLAQKTAARLGVTREELLARIAAKRGSGGG